MLTLTNRNKMTSYDNLTHAICIAFTHLQFRFAFCNTAFAYVFVNVVSEELEHD